MKLRPLFLLPALVLVPAVAEAQNKKEVVAEALFQEGKRLMAEGKFAEACPKLAESNHLDPGAGALTALALCHKSEGKWASAWSEFKEVVSLARRDGRKDREQVALANIAELEPRLARLDVAIDPKTLAPEEEILLDDVVVARAAYGQPLPADPGVHALVARAPGKKTWETTTTVPERKDDKPVLVTVKVPPLEDLPVAATPVVSPTAPTLDVSRGPTNDGRSRRIVAYAVGGAGIAAAAVGAVFGVRALSKQSDSDQLCGDPCASQAGLDANKDARSAANVANVAIGVGVVALAAGVVLWLTAPSGGPPRRASLDGTLHF